jgi:HAD superfamily hydrolase (TIGR01509 family)
MNERAAPLKFKGIIFDFNGVLFWDADFQVKSWKGIAKDLRGREMTSEELDTQMHGRANSYVLSYLAGRTIAGQELTRLIQVKESFYRELCLSSPLRFVLSPGAQDLLETLTQSNIPRTIATSSEITNLESFIKHLRLHQWFDVTNIVYDDGVRPGKPAPDMYLAAARNIGLAASQCVVVEDAISGLQAARAAGIGQIVALGPPTTHPELLARDGVATVIESLAHFPREVLFDRDRKIP